jgi:hypothetical protein
MAGFSVAGVSQYELKDGMREESVTYWTAARGRTRWQSWYSSVSLDDDEAAEENGDDNNEGIAALYGDDNSGREIEVGGGNENENESENDDENERLNAEAGGVWRCL